MGEIKTVISPNIFGKDPNDARDDDQYLDRLNKELETALHSTDEIPQVSSRGSNLVKLRRDEQKKVNEEIGNGGDFSPPIIKKVKLEEALKRFVLVVEGQRVVDRYFPANTLAFSDWKLMYKASIEYKDDKKVMMTDSWLNHKDRITVVGKTFKAGAGEFVSDPEGKLAINMWKDFERKDRDSIKPELFLKHIEFLIQDPSARERFLDWLAHLEQKPGVLPHTAWLHIAPSTGMGRNWLASVLTRVWAGNVASNFDLVSTLNSNFNGQLSRKVLAIVDEIREGGNNQWKHAEKLKSLITEEVRTINPKYGRVSIEFNSCRWLIFSNHLSAIPLARTDRRIEVVVNSGKPQGEAYYKELYGALEDVDFINNVGLYLRNRDISNYNAGSHAVWSEDKSKAASVSKSPVTEVLELIIMHWPADVITTASVLECINYDDTHPSSNQISTNVRRSLEDLGIERLDTRMQIGGKKQYLFCLRNYSKWKEASTSECVSNASSNNCPVGNSNDGKGSGDFLFSIIESKGRCLDTSGHGF